MNHHLLSAAARSLFFLRQIDKRIPWLERQLDLKFSDAEADRIITSCQQAGVKIGRYYHWKIEQHALVSCMQGMDRASFMRMLARSDKSDYSLLDKELDKDQAGFLLAIPHHGHFVASIIACVQHIFKRRHISIFYESPKNNSSNAIFDATHECYFGEASEVSVIHNTRSGLIQAIRELRDGQVVIIMPDIYRSPEDTWKVPFFGGYRSAMLGTAVLSRRTGARIIPMVSRISTSLFEFSTCFSQAITLDQGKLNGSTDVYDDFITTSRIFSAFEKSMAGQFYAWQYTRDHSITLREPATPNTNDMLKFGELLLEDPRINIGASESPPIEIQIPTTS